MCIVCMCIIVCAFVYCAAKYGPLRLIVALEIYVFMSSCLSRRITLACYLSKPLLWVVALPLGCCLRVKVAQGNALF